MSAMGIMHGTWPEHLRAACSGLPEPVGRYLYGALGRAPGPIHSVHLMQQGSLRSSPSSARWMRFEAEQRVEPAALRFSWDASIRIAPLLHLQVHDGLAHGIGSSHVRALSRFTLTSDRDTPELNSAALQRYLAEAVWYPGALLPSAELHWTPLGPRRARATLRHAGNEVSMEFRFNAIDEVESVYTPSRFMRVGKGYLPTPWEGHLTDYRFESGLRVPFHGEVGWHVDGRLGIVWRGEITRLDVAFEPTAA